MTLSQLIEKLEGAEVGSRELDAEIWNTVNQDPHGYLAFQITNRSDARLTDRWDDGWRVGRSGSPNRNPEDLPGLTTSIDAALRYVKENDRSNQITVSTGVKSQAQVSGFFVNNWQVVSFKGRGSTPALAICIALLKALQAKEEQG